MDNQADYATRRGNRGTELSERCATSRQDGSGGRFTFSDMREEGEAVHWGTYVEIKRPQRLVFTWFTSPEEEREDNSMVTLTIEPDGEGCVATIVHRMDARWADYLTQTEQGWSGMLDQIEQRLRTLSNVSARC